MWSWAERASLTSSAKRITTFGFSCAKLTADTATRTPNSNTFHKPGAVPHWTIAEKWANRTGTGYRPRFRLKTRFLCSVGSKRTMTVFKTPLCSPPIAKAALLEDVAHAAMWTDASILSSAVNFVRHVIAALFMTPGMPPNNAGLRCAARLRANTGCENLYRLFSFILEWWSRTCSARLIEVNSQPSTVQRRKKIHVTPTGS